MFSINLIWKLIFFVFATVFLLKYFGGKKVTKTQLGSGVVLVIIAVILLEYACQSQLVTKVTETKPQTKYIVKTPGSGKPCPCAIEDDEPPLLTKELNAQRKRIEGFDAADVQSATQTASQAAGTASQAASQAKATGSQAMATGSKVASQAQSTVQTVQSAAPTIKTKAQTLAEKSAQAAEATKSVVGQRSLDRAPIAPKIPEEGEEEIIEDEMKYTQLPADMHQPLGKPQRWPTNYNEYGYWFVPPNQWHPPCSRPPICETQNGCPVQPVLTTGTYVDLLDFDRSRRISGSPDISIPYIRDVINK